MAKEMIVKAASVEEAKAQLAAMFGVDESRLSFEVIQQPQKKTLGLFGGSDAEVRGVLEDASPAEAVKAFLQDVLAGMGAGEVTVAIREENEICTLLIDGEDLGFLIGRRGETLDALQYLAGLVANRADNTYFRISVDIGNYREKREKTLVALASRIGRQVARTGRKISLEPMNPYERRIIHTAVQEIEGAISWSVGSDAGRHVVIGPSEDNPAAKNRSRRRRGGRGHGGEGQTKAEPQAEQGVDESEDRPRRSDRRSRSDDPTVAPGRPVRQFVPRSNPLPMADGATPPQKTTSETEETATLYGRIDL